MKVAIVGTSCIGMSMPVLPSQHHRVVALDMVPAKVYTHDLFGGDS